MASSVSNLSAGRVASASERVETSTAPAPIIGITTYLEQSQTGVWDVPASFLPKVYLDAVTNAGGIAVLLPPQPVDTSIAARVIAGLDGLVVAGGKDVDPARYGQERHELTDESRPDRDAWESALFAAAIETGVPFIGICRGLQVLNVALGGTLHQHLPDVLGTSRYTGVGGVFAHNEVMLGASGIVPDLLESTPTLAVQSYHHQAIDRVADGLAVTARSDDGTVQAVEVQSVPFGIAVQWHPEQSPDDLRLFAGLVDAAKEYRGSSESRASSESRGSSSSRPYGEMTNA